MLAIFDTVGVYPHVLQYYLYYHNPTSEPSVMYKIPTG